MTSIDDFRTILCCPSCHADLAYHQHGAKCVVCGKNASCKDRLVDFRLMSPSLPLHINKPLNEIYESAGNHQPDLKADFRIDHVLRAISKIDKKGVCLEVGGADGLMTPTLERMFDRMLTIDCSPSFLRRIEIKTTKTLCLCGDGQFMPVQESTIDIAVCTEVLEHVTIPTQLLLELRRVMKKDAVLILSVPNEFTIPFWDRKNAINKPSDAHLSFFTPRLLTLLLNRTGFEIVTLQTIAAPIKTLRGLLGFGRESVGRAFMGNYIFCVLRIMSNPTVYWDSLGNLLASNGKS